MQSNRETSDTEVDDVKTPEKITENIDVYSSSDDDRRSIDNKNQRKSLIKHHV